jgi:hypothetical protein
MKLKSLLDFCEDVNPMSEEDAKMFVTMCMLESQRGKDWVTDEEPDHLAYKIIKSRMQNTGVHLTFSALFFLSVLSRFPGEAVMWAYTACAIGEKYHKKEVDMQMLALEFPDGFPSTSEKNKCWDSQKDYNAPLGNAMDVQENWAVEGL